MYNHRHLHTIAHCSLAADIVAERLEVAKMVGADIVINCKEENLKERYSQIIIIIP